MKKEKTKVITISETDELISFSNKGFNKFELLGLLRLFEQQTSIAILQGTYDKDETEKPQP